VKEFVIHTDAPLETVIDFDAGKTGARQRELPE